MKSNGLRTPKKSLTIQDFNKMLDRDMESPNHKNQVVSRTRADSSFFYTMGYNSSKDFDSIKKINENNNTTMYNQAYRVLSNPIFSGIVLAMSSLYFVVTGVQYWATDYLITGQL